MITIEQTRIINVMGSGVRLCRAHRPDGDEWFFSDAKIRAPKSNAIEGLVRMGVVAPAGDGLFEDDSQTFGLVFVPGEA